MEFKAFEKISKFTGINMTITQKIHGTNAQIIIVPVNDFSPKDQSEVDAVNADIMSPFVWVEGKLYQLEIGSRTRFIVPGDDNYGFARFVRENKVEIVAKLGPGTHFGEWAGPGINSGEGLKEKMFVLFNHYRFPPERPLPKNCTVVPILYTGPYSDQAVRDVLLDLKTNGSKLSPGFMRPEGVVIEVAGKRYKKVFEPEETKWTQGSAGPKVEKIPGIDCSHLLQPIRLEKLLSRDERYLRNYPESLRDIAADYAQDLIDEGQITGTENEIRAMKKTLGGQLFPFLRAEINRIQGGF